MFYTKGGGTHIGFNVLVLEVECLLKGNRLSVKWRSRKGQRGPYVFPDINTNKWNMGDQRVLVCSGNDFDLLCCVIPAL